MVGRRARRARKNALIGGRRGVGHHRSRAAGREGGAEPAAGGAAAAAPIDPGPPVAKVEPITTARALRGPFDYLRPEGVGVGSVLVVPFGHREVVGVVVGLADGSALPDDRLAAPRRVLDHDLPPDLVELALWM